MPSASTESNESAVAMIIRPCLRVNFALFASSAKGREIACRSCGLSLSLATSRSESNSSSTPRKAKDTYQSVTTRKTTREKKSSQSSRLGGPDFAFVLTGFVSSTGSASSMSSASMASTGSMFSASAQCHSSSAQGSSVDCSSAASAESPVSTLGNVSGSCP